MQIKITGSSKMPLYCVQEKELTLDEFAVVYPTAKTQRVIEVMVGNAIRAYGVREGSSTTPMQAIVTFCDYHEQNGHRGCFVALEPKYITQLHDLFPDRFVRVGLVIESPYEMIT